MTTPIDQPNVTRRLERLRAEYPAQTDALTDAELSRRVGSALSFFQALVIDNEADMPRYLAVLAVLLPPEQLRSRLIACVVPRILAAPDWDTDKRLDFFVRARRGSPGLGRGLGLWIDLRAHATGRRGDSSSSISI